MSILALDLATTTGWALAEGGNVGFGHRRFDGDVGEFAFGLERWLANMLTLHAVDTVYVEAPLTRLGGFTNLGTTLRLIGAQVIVAKVCFEHGITGHAISVGTWRKHFIGRGRAPVTIPKSKRRKWLKDAVMAECAKRGWQAANDNAADALGLLDYATNQAA